MVNIIQPKVFSGNGFSKSCADARGLKNIPLIEGTEISTMEELTNWVVDSDKVVTF